MQKDLFMKVCFINILGLFIDGKLHGKGKKYRNINTEYYCYIGSFLNGKKNGYGREDTIDYEYQGDFENDKMHGKGKFTYIDGNNYDG